MIPYARAQKTRRYPTGATAFSQILPDTASVYTGAGLSIDHRRYSGSCLVEPEVPADVPCLPRFPQ